MTDRSLRILSVNTHESGGGGAARVADVLASALRSRGHRCQQAVKRKESSSVDVFQFDDMSQVTATLRFCRWFQQKMLKTFPVNSIGWRALRKVNHLSRRAKALLRERAATIKGEENFDFPATWNLVKRGVREPDLVHLHNLHGEYFDLRILPWLSSRQPTFVTLHDMWMLTGHCAYPIDCERWKSGCGSCPYPNIYPAIRYDATAHNRQRKSDIYAKSRLYVATPSRWLLDRALESILAPGIVESRVIPNGIDTSIFYVGSRLEARKALNIDADAQVLLYVATEPRTNPFKDFETLLTAIHQIAAGMPDSKIVFLALGDNSIGARESYSKIGNADVRLIPFQSDQRGVALHYRATDVCLHAAKMETFGLVIAESSACGTPVVATNVGGIPDLIRDGQTGFLVPPRNAELMAQRAILLLRDTELRSKMSAAAASFASGEFSADNMVSRYLSWYSEIYERENKSRRACHAPVNRAA